MKGRFAGLIVSAGLAAAGAIVGPGSALGQTGETGGQYVAPRTTYDQPDLQGFWTNASITPLERPEELGNKAFYTKEEYEKALAKLKEAPTNVVNGSDVHYDLAQFGLDRGSASNVPNLRTSLIVDPPNGRIPAMKPEAQTRNAERNAYRRAHMWDAAEFRGLSERCIVWGSEGPPMLPVGYNADMQIVQSQNYVAILQEMIHDVRIIPLDNRPHLDAGVQQWLGDSVGHWEGETLVVDTKNFTDQTAFRGSSANLHVVERFTRVNPDTIRYQFTVEDPDTWDQPWSGEVPMSRIEGPIFEYACHEGNYGMPNILSGVRAEERAAEEAAKKK
jgi:hypothetical protein